MDRLKCAECGKSLEHETKAHPGIGIARQYLKAPARNLDHVGPLLDSLNESGHMGLHRYVSAALAHHQEGGSRAYLRHAARDVARVLRRPGTAAALRWHGPHEPNRPEIVARAHAGHGRYDLHNVNGDVEVHYIPMGRRDPSWTATGTWYGALYRAAAEHHRDTLAGYEAEE